MTGNNPIGDLLSAPLAPDWTVERLAEQALDAIAALRTEDSQEFVLDETTATSHQARRLLRPLLACLATKAAAESGLPADLYGGPFAFERSTPNGSIWVLGAFENRPGSVRVTLRRSGSSPGIRNTEPKSPVAPSDAGIRSATKEFTIHLKELGVIKVRGYRLQPVAPTRQTENSWLGVLAAPGEEGVYAALFPGPQVIAAFCDGVGTGPHELQKSGFEG